MKYLLLTLFFCTFIYAETMSLTDHLTLNTYNKRPSLKHTSDKRAHKLNKIDEKQAIAIAEKKCKEDIVKLKLKHHNLYLYYIAKTPKCTLFINALDGSIIDSKIINMGSK